MTYTEAMVTLNLGWLMLVAADHVNHPATRGFLVLSAAVVFTGGVIGLMAWWHRRG